MSASDIANFLTDLFTRYDPSLDLSEGSRAQTELIGPILARIGGDPFDDDIPTFLRTRLQQVFPNLAIGETDELTDLLVDPMRVLLEPISREIQLVKLRTSLNNLESLSDDEVDALLGNFFESRKAGGYAVGTVRAYFSTPQSVNITLIHVAQSRGGLRFIVPRPQSITADQMLLNVSGSEYYFDINYIGEARGDEYNVEKGEITSISNLMAATRVTNLRRFSEGVARETSAEFAARVQRGTTDKTLTTEPGITAVLTDNFPTLRQVFDVGYGDPEMKRDLITGAGLGAIPSDDALGRFYGTGTPIDDLDADTTTALLEAAGGNFVSRVAAPGTKPDGWYVTLVYSGGGDLIVRDVAVTEVVSDTRLRVDHEMPLGLKTGAVTWMLRPQRITLSAVPGGIALPDTPAGTLSLSAGTVHIGGKTDVFVAGELDAATAQIQGLTDEAPIGRGVAAQTQGATTGQEDVVLLPDVPPGTLAAVEPGMTLVLSEGADVGAYRIVQVFPNVPAVRLDTALTGAQNNLLWKIVDDIDVDLVTPKDVLLEGNDLVLSAGSADAMTTSGVNFSAAGVRRGDVLWVDHPAYGGDYTITAVTPTILSIDPVAPRALGGVHYVLSRRSEGVERPVLRVKGLELLDSSGAPNGTTIPYRDPVLVLSRGFQNEGSSYLYDGPAFVGLVSTKGFSGTAQLGGSTLLWTTRDPSRGWATSTASGSFTFAANEPIGAAVDRLNRNASLRNAGVRGVLLRYAGQDYLGLTSQRLVTITGGSALSKLGWVPGITNAQISTTPGLAYFKVRRGDVIELVGGNNSGIGVRIITDPSTEQTRITTGNGPFGPAGTTAQYDLATLNPEVGGRIRVARPSVGSARCYFLDPTSIDFDYRATRLTTTINGQQRVYQPDPENTRVLVPPPPSTTLPASAAVRTARTLEDTTTDFFSSGIREGDLLDVLYRPISSDAALPDSTPLALAGQSLFLRLDNDSYISIVFPYAMSSSDAADYINAQVGTSLASLAAGKLVLKSSRRIELSAGSTAMPTLLLTTFNSDHPSRGTYIIESVNKTVLTVASTTPMPGMETPDTHYRIRRYFQRTSSTEMNVQQDASGLYYADVEAVSLFAGDSYNIPTDIELAITGHRSDGYRLVTGSPELSFSRAEPLRAEISRTLLLVGASDNPQDYVQLNMQNVQVSYERSSLADEIQSFVQSRYRRVICEDILVRHLFPHYVSMRWRYHGGASEADMLTAIKDALARIAGGEQLEVGNLISLLLGKGASSVYAVDTASSTGRTAPLLLVVSHNEDRSVRASLVRDVVDTVRMATYLPDDLDLKRLSSAGVRS